MGILKRILRKTSRKLLSKLVVQRQTGRLVLNAPVQQIQVTSNKKRSRKTRRNKKSSREATIPEALLLAAKSQLPPVQFHYVHGPHAQLSSNKLVARRTQGFCQALVFSSRVILPNERVYIKVLDIARGWSGTIRFGFTSVDPATLLYQLPKHVCPDMTNEGRTWARALADEVVRRNSVIHFSYNSSGYIHYGINNQDCGIFHANVSTSQHLWFVVDIYGLTSAVELIDPRTNTTNNELSLFRNPAELGNENEQPIDTMFKSTRSMNELLTHYGAVQTRNKKRRGRKMKRSSNVIYEHWPPEGLLMASTRAHLLPNLSSIILPQAQQNIYSPMPNVDAGGLQTNRGGIDAHDYYQIMTNCQTSDPNQSLASSNIPQNATISSSLNSSLNNSRRVIVEDSEREICQQMDSLQMSDNNGQQIHHQSATTTKSPKSTTANTVFPVAAARSRLQNNLDQTAFKRATISNGRDKTKIDPSSQANAKCPSANVPNQVKPRARHSTKTQKQSQDNNAASRDCPICFERPINCVLYQCGHMCTCYECGVKQWKTQSRTCPICRTVIKDVIKTYMS